MARTIGSSLTIGLYHAPQWIINSESWSVAGDSFETDWAEVKSLRFRPFEACSLRELLAKKADENIPNQTNQINVIYLLDVFPQYGCRFPPFTQKSTWPTRPDSP